MQRLAEVGLQSLISFFVLFVLARVVGKRQIALLTFFDYVVGITIGDIAASWSLDTIKSSHAILTLLIWTLLPMALAWIQRKSYRGRVLLDGRPVVLVENGQVLEHNLKNAHMSTQELMLMLRAKDVFKVSDVEYAVYENNGTMSVMKKSDTQPVTPKDLGMSVTLEHAPRMLIIDGNVMERSLADLGYTKEWLMGEVTKHGATDFRDVFLAQIDSNGSVYVDLYHDRLYIPQVKAKPMIAATLKKLEADLETFALETRNPDAKQSYAKMVEHLKNLNQQLLPYLKE